MASCNTLHDSSLQGLYVYNMKCKFSHHEMLQAPGQSFNWTEIWWSIWSYNICVQPDVLVTGVLWWTRTGWRKNDSAQITIIVGGKYYVLQGSPPCSCSSVPSDCSPESQYYIASYARFEVILRNAHNPPLFGKSSRRTHCTDALENIISIFGVHENIFGVST